MPTGFLVHWKLLFESCLHPRSLSSTFMSPFLLKVVILWAKAWLCVCMLNHFSHVQFFATLSTAGCRTPLSMGFSRQEYWSGLPCPPPGGLPNPGIKPTSPMSPALVGWFLTTRATWESPKAWLLDLNILLYSQQEASLQKYFFCPDTPGSLHLQAKSSPHRVWVLFSRMTQGAQQWSSWEIAEVFTLQSLGYCNSLWGWLSISNVSCCLHFHE